MAGSLVGDHRYAAVASSYGARYRLAIRAHLAPKLGHHRLNRLRPEHLEAAYLELVAGGLAASTVLYAHRVLSPAMSVAVRRGMLPRNEASLVDPPRGRPADSEPLTLTDARAVLVAANGERNGARWSVALALGLRQGEALGLTSERSIDLVTGDLIVGQALQRITYRHGCSGRRSATRPVCAPPECTTLVTQRRRCCWCKA